MVEAVPSHLPMCLKAGQRGEGCRHWAETSPGAWVVVGPRYFPYWACPVMLVAEGASGPDIEGEAEEEGVRSMGRSLLAVECVAVEGVENLALQESLVVLRG